jgi:hypothetical protein
LVTGTERLATSICVLAVLWTMVPGTAGARSAPGLEFAKSVDLPSAGFSVKLMPGASEHPLPSPTVHTYVITRGTSQEKVEMFSPAEFWRRGQYAGKWSDKNGNSLALASIQRLLPDGFPHKHATRKAIEERLAFRYLVPKNWDESTIQTWVRAFTGVPDAKSSVLRKKPARMTEVMQIEFPANRHRLGYAFQFNRRYIGQSRAPSSWFFADFDLDAKTDVESARKAIVEQFIASATPRFWSSRERDKSTAFQDKRFRKSADVSPSMEASRKEVEESIRNMRGWWHVHTENYIILSNLDGRSRTMIKQIQRDIERLRDVFAKLIPPTLEFTDVSVVRAFATPAEYEAYVPGELKWTSGVWIPNKRELVIRPLSGDTSKDRKENVLRTVYHEAFHQYLHYAFDRTESSAWYNEGTAVFFQNAELGSSSLVTIMEDRQKASRLQTLANKNQLDVEGMLRMSYREFYDGNEETRLHNYSLAWGLIYYLRKAAIVERHSNYAGILDSYSDAMRKTENAREATTIAFNGIQMDTFRKDFTSFWISSRRRRAAARNKIMRRHR